LKRGIPFHAGYGEVTALDVKYSYERIAGITKPTINSSYQGDWSALGEVRVTGTYSGVIGLKHLFAPLYRTTLPLERGYVVSQRAVLDRGGGFATAPVGTGPYELVDWEPRNQAVLHRFADYGGARYGYADKVLWDEIHFALFGAVSVHRVSRRRCEPPPPPVPAGRVRPVGTEPACSNSARNFGTVTAVVLSV
jgi:peptide/nickel transport system substrate-binding protein